MQTKYLPKHQLKKVIQQVQRQGKKVVFTNGCFDLLHVGHVRLLRKAKQYGDVLAVAINADSSVRKLKGPTRPLTPQNERAEILSALAVVDYVTIFTDDTPYRIIKYLRPDVLVKGADWKKDDIIGADIVSRTVRVKLVANHSTSRLITRIKSLPH